MAAGIVQQVIGDLVKHPRFHAIRELLSGANSCLPFEAALTQALYTMVNTDLSDGAPYLDWQCLLPRQVVGALSRSVGSWGDPMKAQSDLATLWLGLYSKPERPARKLTNLASLLVNEFQKCLKQDRFIGIALYGKMQPVPLEALASSQLVAEEVDRYRYLVAITLRQIPDFWNGLTLPSASEDVALDAPFIVRVDLHQTDRRLRAPLMIYPGEKAILLSDGQTIEAPLGPGKLDPESVRRRYVGSSRGKRLEAIIYRADRLHVSYRQIEARSVDDERILITCKLRFTISNIVAFQTGIVRKSQIYTLSQLRDRLVESVELAAREFMRDLTFRDVEASPRARELLDTAIQQEFQRPVHGFKEIALCFDGLVSFRAMSPAVEIGRTVKDRLDEQHKALEEEKNGLSRVLDVWREVEMLRNQIPGAAVVPGIEPLVQPTVPIVNEHTTWRFPPEGSSLYLSPIRSRPVINGQRVFLAEQDGKIHCLDLASGQPCQDWSSPRLPDEVHGGLVVTREGSGAPILLVPCTDGKLYALDPKTGTTLNSHPTGGRLRSTPLFAHGWVYLSCAVQSAWGGVVALRLGDGKEMGRWQSPSKRGVLGTPALDNQNRTLYFGTLDDDGNTVFAADVARSGDARLIFRTTGPIRFSPILAPERQHLYVTSQSGIVHALTLKGKEQWKRQLDGPVSGAGTIANDVFYVGDESGAVHALDLNHKGADVWPPFKARGPVTTRTILYEGLLIFGSGDGNIYAVDIETGELYAEFSTGAEVLASPVVCENGLLLVGCGGQKGGVLYAIPWHLGRNG